MLKQDYYNDFFEIGQQKINFNFFDAFYDFKGKKLAGEVLDELNYQFMRRLEKEGLITLKELYIDGTEIEANANRYTFVWRAA